MNAGNAHQRRRSSLRGSAAILLAAGASVLLAVLGSTNLMVTNLKQQRAVQALQEEVAREANQNSIELVAKLFEKKLLVALYSPPTPPIAAPPPSVPSWENCSGAGGTSAECAAFSVCSSGPYCQKDDPSTDGDAPPSSKAELLKACASALPPGPDCSKVCGAKDCQAACKAAKLGTKECNNICSAKPDSCQSTCLAAVPEPPPCKLCVPDPDSPDGCESMVAMPSVPPLNPPTDPKLRLASLPAFEATEGIYLTLDKDRLSALPHGAKFVHGYLKDARLERLVVNPKRLTDVQKNADQQLDSGAFVADTSCAKQPEDCLSQKTVFGKVIDSSATEPGSIEVQAATEVPGFRFGRPPVLTRARITISKIGPAPVPTCSLTASPTMVYSHFTYAGNMWTTLSLALSSNPRFPGLITTSSLAGVSTGATGGVRVVPYPYGATQYTYYATVTGPGGSSGCSATVYSTCVPRAPVCVPHKCWYPVDNFPRCAGWVVCPEGHECWYRGEILGCFAPETPIAVSEKEVRKIATLSTGNFVWNPVTKTAVRLKSRIVGPEALPLVEIGYDKRTIRVTTEHPIVTRRGLLRAGDLRKSDWLQGEDLEFHPVTHLTRGRTPATKNSQTVINLEIDTPSEAPEDHYLLADGIVVGDYYLQNKLQRDARARAKP